MKELLKTLVVALPILTVVALTNFAMDSVPAENVGLILAVFFGGQVTMAALYLVLRKRR